MLYIFIGCLTFGVLYSILSAFLGGHGFDHGSFDSAGVHVDGTDHSADVPSPFNPLVIASAITAFGAAGIIGKMAFGLNDVASSGLGLAASGIIGAAMFFGVVKLMYSSQSDSTFSLLDIIGMEAEVITPIPQNGMGEIAYVLNSERHSLPAKAVLGGQAAKGEIVKVKEVVGNVALVTRKMNIDDLEYLENNRERFKESEKND